MKMRKLKNMEWATDGRTLRLLLAAALLLIVAGSRLFLIGRFGSDLPFYDQWEAEAEQIFQRYYNGTLAFSDWFAPHNEHRVFFARLFSFALLEANGQWDGRLQMVVNAFVYAFFSGVLFLLLARYFRKGFAIPLAVVIAVVFSHPVGHENTLCGFQIQFYLLISLSAVAIWLLVNHPPWALPWTVGVIISFAALFTMASGFMAAAAVLAFMLFTLTRNMKNWCSEARALLPTGVVCLLVIVSGLFLYVKVEGHAIYRARSMFQFLDAFGYALSWPMVAFSPWWSLLNWTPFIAAAIWLRRSLAEDRVFRFNLALGIWLLLQAAATAFSRATIVHSPRYADMFGFALLVNSLSFLLMAKELFRLKKKVAPLVVIALMWVSINGFDLYRLTSSTFRFGLPVKLEWNAIEEYRTAGYVISDNYTWLVDGVRRKFDIPYPDPVRLAKYLNAPEIRGILPASVREPLSLSVRSGSPATMVKTDQQDGSPPYWGERIWQGKTGAVGEDPLPFGWTAAKDRGLPFIFMHVAGDPRQLAVVDDKGNRHSVKPLPAKWESEWQPVYAYCPGSTVGIVSSSSGSVGAVAFSEPRELGRLSLIALMVADRALLVLGAGLALFGLALPLGRFHSNCSPPDRQEQSPLASPNTHLFGEQ